MNPKAEVQILAGLSPRTSKATQPPYRDMDPETWRRNQDRPQYVRAHHDDLADALSDTTAGHLPDPDASTFEYRQFLNDYKGTVTRQLADDDEAGDSE